MRTIKKFLLALAVIAAGVADAAASDYWMESGDGHAVTVTEPMYFYDDGGPTGVMTKGFSGSVTFIPGVEGKAIKINTEEFALSGNKMYVYNGREVNSANILGSEKGYFVSTGPTDLVSEAADGSLTVQFTCKIGTTLKGWKIAVTLVDKPTPQAEPMSGEYRVGSSAEARFRNLAELEKAFEAGVGGPVTIMLEDNEFNENFLLKEIKGVSEKNTITITSVSGNASACVIGGSSTVLDYQGTVCVDATPFVTFRNVTVSAPEGNGSRTPYAALHFRNGSHDCAVENCGLKAPLTSVNDNRTYVLLANSGASAGSACDGLVVTGCRISGGYIGMFVGPDPEGSNRIVTKRLSVCGNEFADINYRGLDLSDCEGFNVSCNSINPGRSGKKSAAYLNVNRPSGAFRIESNSILSEQSTDCTGINLRGGGGSASVAEPALIANNVVALPKITSSYTYGMMVDASMTNLIVAHNSINIATVAKNIKNIYGMAFSGKAPEKGLSPVIASNVVRVSFSGVPLRPWDATHYANLTFKNNVYYGAAGPVDSDNNTFEAYRTATGDETSVWHEAQFLSNSDLHLLNVDGMLTPRLELVTVDRDGKERSATTAAGAYEFEQQKVDLPEISGGYPVVGAISSKTVEVKTRWTVGGSLYAKAVPVADPAPTAEELLRLQPVAIEADKESTSVFSSLQPSTDYKGYFMVVSALDAKSEIVTSPQFTTLEEIQPLTAFIFWKDEPFKAGETVELMAAPEGGVRPYSYRWTDQAGEEIGTSESVSFTAVANGTYKLKVTSSDGQSTVCKVNVPVVTDELIVATFDDLYLAPESNWMYDADLAEGGLFTDRFYSGSFSFGNTSMPSYNSWFGYGYSNETSTGFVSLADQMRNVVGGGAENTAGYAVGYLYGADTRINLSVGEAGVKVPGMYVTNSAYTLTSIVSGDSYNPKFVAGDYHELVIEGFLGDEATGKVSVSLADYRTETPFILNEWKWIDLSLLGNINKLRLSFDGTKTQTVPAYVCLDQIGAAKPDESSIADIEVDNDLPVIYFDLQGRRVAADNLTPGIYIRRQGNRTVKVIVR